MSLKPPTDLSRPLLFAVTGVSLALLIATYKSHYLPSVGDNIHSLPHGGHYSDGTKSISYNGLNCQQNHSQSFTSSSSKLIPLTLVFLVSFLIYVSSKLSNRSPSIQHYCIHHH
uniref:Movement protein TGB2 n=1 Tax=Cherry green ring mottle virus TaxID=65467 RepID=A0A0S2SVG3_9VIRU|nr:triple gene block protein 2 [Cherry green ring mottle virus]ALP45929.1 triple gene block protein 2 [Cherry green ring mottle virus]